MPRIPATVVSTLSVRKIGAKPVVLAAGLICSLFLQACSDDYAAEFHGYERVHLDSLELPARILNDTSGTFFHLQDFSVGPIERFEYDVSSENRGSGGFATWMRRNPHWGIRLFRRESGQTSPNYTQLRVYVDSINPYKSDPRRGLVRAHRDDYTWGGYGTRLEGTIESSIAMDEVIADHKPFTFTMSLRDTSGLFIVLTDSALLWTEYNRINPWTGTTW
ncbi:MAG: hypothetical protein AAB214_18735 [Fibrobacterota bacterium]